MVQAGQVPLWQPCYITLIMQVRALTAALNGSGKYKYKVKTRKLPQNVIHFTLYRPQSL